MGPDPAVATVRRAVRSALAPLPAGALVLVACSGGADSLALAAAAAFEAPRRGLRCGAVTVDHGLQPGSAAHADGVLATLGALHLAPREKRTVTVGGPGGPEAAARTARYRAIEAAADRLDATAVLLGHTRDDQAETVLLGLARGSGARSLAGMAPAAGRYLRPLLAVPRATTRAACAAMGLAYWEDPHNSDVRYARVRVRREVLPELERELGPGITEALARTAALLRADADALDGWADDAAAGARVPGGLDVAALRRLPDAVRTRVLRRAAVRAGCPPGELFAVHVDEVDRLVTAWHGQRGIDLPGSLAARRHGGTLSFERVPGAAGRPDLPAHPPVSGSAGVCQDRDT